MLRWGQGQRGSVVCEYLSTLALAGSGNGFRGRLVSQDKGLCSIDKP